MRPCMKIHNRRATPVVLGTGEVDYRMRPGTPSPDLHWSSRAMGRLGYPRNAQTCGDREGPEIWMTSEFQDEDPEGFEWLMRFVRSEQLEITIDPEQCAACGGHPMCASHQQNLLRQESK